MLGSWRNISVPCRDRRLRQCSFPERRIPYRRSTFLILRHSPEKRKVLLFCLSYHPFHKLHSLVAVDVEGEQPIYLRYVLHVHESVYHQAKNT